MSRTTLHRNIAQVYDRTVALRNNYIPLTHLACKTRPHHRLSKLRNRDWHPPTHERAHVCCLPVYFVDATSGSKSGVSRATQPMDMAVSITGTDFSSLDAFIAILCKLASNDFVSKRLPRHCAIRKQIEAFLQSSVELEPLSAALHEEVFTLVLSLPAQKGRHHSFQVALWPQFHHLCTQVVPRIWQSKQHIVDDEDPLLLQNATQEYAVMLLQKKYGEGSRSSNFTHHAYFNHRSMLQLCCAAIICPYSNDIHSYDNNSLCCGWPKMHAGS